MKLLDTIGHILLIVAIGVGVAGIYTFRFDSRMQLVIIFSLVGFYLVWALIFHWVKKDLGKKLFLEYLLIAAIVSVASYLVFSM